ncbi:unnamed protein product, partial [Closterium sp. Naga37s-1]
VRLFNTEDAPCMAISTGLGGAPPAPSTSFRSSMDGPPGFSRPKKVRCDSAAVAAMVTQTPWKSPEKVELEAEWQVVAGEDSAQVEVQKQREMRSFEAFYPRPSAIPDS